MKNFAEAVNKFSPQIIIHTALPKPKVDFIRELISTKIVPPKKVMNISDVINMSKNMSDFKENLDVFTKENIETIEKLTIGQNENEYWYEYRKCLITASKAHDVVTKMAKVQKGGGETISIWSLNYFRTGFC